MAAKVAELAAAIAGRPRPVVVGESWLSPAELGDLVGKSSTTVRRWIRDQGLPAKQVGAGYLVRYRDFVRWQSTEGQTVRAAAAEILERLS